MISYSDYVLSQRPWGYWTLSDPPLTQYDENHTLIDCSGHQRNLITKKTDITYNVALADTLHDSLPLTGIRIIGGGSSFNENFVYYPGSTISNDVSLENGLVSHVWSPKRYRAEALTETGAILIGNFAFSSGTAYYNITHYHKENDYWYATQSFDPVAFYTPGSRIIGDMEWVDEKNIIVTIVIDNVFIVNRQLVTLPDEDSSTQYRRFSNPSYEIALCNGVIGNFSVFYEKELTSDYVTQSWNALSTPFVQSVSENIIKLSDYVDSSKILSVFPNSSLQQFDTLLIRGFSHRVFSKMTVSPLQNGDNEIRLWLNTIDIDYTGDILLHDFKIGDIVLIGDFTQTHLNTNWKIERIEFDAVFFTISETVVDETGYFLIKRTPIGGGAWSRNVNNEYVSLSSTLGKKLVIDDTNKTSSVFSIKDSLNTDVFLRRYFKRDSSHYLGEDLGLNRTQWTIIGDNLRFIFVAAYKQNPKTHCRIIVFGNINDVNDDHLKTILIGYDTNQIGDVGFNKLFEYYNQVFSSTGILQASPIEQPPSGIGWILSDKNGNFNYLQGIKDCGQHQYPIPNPLS